MVTELFSPPRVAAEIRAAAGAEGGIDAGTSLDLTVDGDTGESYGFLDASHLTRGGGGLTPDDPRGGMGALQ